MRKALANGLGSWCCPCAETGLRHTKPMRKLDATENAADRAAKLLNSCVGQNVGVVGRISGLVLPGSPGNFQSCPSVRTAPNESTSNNCHDSDRATGALPETKIVSQIDSAGECARNGTKMLIVGRQTIPWARSLTENIVVNLIASAIAGALAAFTGKANHLPTSSVVFLGTGVFSITLVVLLLMAVRVDRRAKAEAALPLLRDVGLHMLLNRPLNHGVLEQLGRNITWWRERTIGELTRAGASEYHISRLRDSDVLDVNTAGDTPQHAHARSVAATCLRRLEEAIAALGIK